MGLTESSLSITGYSLSICWNIRFADSICLSLTLLLQTPFYVTCYGEDLRIRLQLLGYQGHLDIYHQALLKPVGSFLFIDHHVGCESAESQKFCRIFIYCSVPLLQFDKLFFHLFLGHCRKEPFVEAFSRTGARRWASPVSPLLLTINHQVQATSLNCILATLFWPGIQAAFKRYVVLINHYSASKSFSVPENTACCSLLKSETFSGVLSNCY